MHHVMAYASLYIGDSQTMAAEAGVLGVPFVRFNDFVGRIGYLRELEDVYQLGYGVHATPLQNDASTKPNEPLRSMSYEQSSLNDGTKQASGADDLYRIVEELVAMKADERKALFQERRMKMLSEKIDCAKFLTWFIEEYPGSVAETRKADAAFWAKFK